jgi:tetratricopeptide (TPR) repeat protein
MKGFHLASLVLMTLGTCLGACSRSEEPESEASLVESETEQVVAPEEAAEPPVNKRSSEREFKQALIVAHRAADEAKNRVAEEKAARLLEQALTLPPAPGEASLILRQDLSVRAATLRLRGGELKQAEVLVRQGLALSEAPSAARAQLFITLADVEEAKGQADDAKQALLNALAINQELFEKELEEP